MAIRKEIETLLPKRLRKDRPKYDDWSEIQAVIGLVFLKERDASLYCTEKLSRKTGLLLSKIITNLEAAREYLNGLLVRPSTADLSRLSLAAKSLAKLSISGINDKSGLNRNLQRFIADSNTFLATIKKETVGESRDEALTYIGALLKTLITQNTALPEFLEGFKSAMTAYAATDFSSALVQKAALRGLKDLENVQNLTNPGLKKTVERIIALQTTLQEQMTVIYPSEVIYSGAGQAYAHPDKEGLPATIIGTRSGPFVYSVLPAGIDLDVDGNNFTPGLAAASKAVLVSSASDPLLPPANPSWQLGLACGDVTIRYKVSVNGAVVVNVDATITTMGGNDYLEVTQLGAGWTAAGLPITIQYTGISNEFLEVLTNRYGEDATITVDSWELLPSGALTTPANWTTDPMSVVGYIKNLVIQGLWRTVYEVADEVMSNCPVAASSVRTTKVSGKYGSVVAGGQVLTLRKIDTGVAVDLVITDGSKVLHSNTYNLKAHEIIPGDKILVDPAGVAELLTVGSVDGSDITVTTVPVIVAGTYTFLAYPDLFAVAQHDLVVTDYGSFKVQAVLNDTVTVQTYFPYNLSVLTTAFSIVNDLLKLTSPTEDVSSEVAINAASAELGLAGTAGPRLYGLEFAEDLSNYDIRTDDMAVGVTYSESVHSADGKIRLKVPITVAPEAVEIKNLDYVTWIATKASIIAWQASYAAELETTIQAITAITRSQRPQSAQIAKIKVQINTTLTNLNSLLVILQNHSIRSLGHIEQVFDAIKDMGIDRALYFLESCRFSEFFGLKSNELTYADFFNKEARSLVRGVANTNRYEDATFDELLHYGIVYGESERFGED